jgi:prepilin-type N-terminal cleavage/methylation domain-containing protein
MKLSLKNKKGFTLIELLVAIAVIALLASIVWVALSEVKNRAKDARVIAEMNQIQKKAILYYNSNQSYENLNMDNEISKITDDIRNLTNNNVSFAYPEDDYSQYCASIKLNNGNYYCIDSRGAAKQIQGGLVCVSTGGLGSGPRDVICRP